MAQGVYYPANDPLNAQRSVTFQLVADVALYGGFLGDEHHREQRDRVLYPTVLSGDIGDLDVKDDNAYHVVTGADDAVIDGFTITGGNATGTGSNDEQRGGGMYNNQSSPRVSHCTFQGNSATWGAGMFNHNRSSPAVSQCTFQGNSAGSWGGGMANMTTVRRR